MKQKTVIINGQEVPVIPAKAVEEVKRWRFVVGKIIFYIQGHPCFADI